MTESFIDLIVKKRDGGEFTGSEIGRLVAAIARHEVPDHQIGALLMAIYLQSLSARETAYLTLAMADSGATIDLGAIEGFKADKHSTGGVGDKVTLVLGPLVAAAGIKFPKLSGRGLGHTGGTLDKLESIPGLRVDLSITEFVDQVRAIGIAVTGQTSELVPADKVLYNLRDQTGTVDSIPLIASSIMSKKLAGGADGIVLDVKCGRGAFMKTVDDATELARQMVAIGVSGGKSMRALVTAMDMPLGLAIGNATEVREAIDCLHGRGPRDLIDEVLGLGVAIVMMASESTMSTPVDGIANSQQAIELLRELVAGGQAADRLRDMIRMQGGNPAVVDDTSLLPTAQTVETLFAPSSGYIQSIDSLAIGEVVMDLGAGRRSKDADVLGSGGVVLRAKPDADRGRIDAGAPLIDLHIPEEWDQRAELDEIRERAVAAFTIGSRPAPRTPSILAILSDTDL